MIFWLLNNVWYDNAVSNICWMFFEGKCMLLYVVFGVNLIFVSHVVIRLLSDLVDGFFVRGVCVSNDVVLLLLIGVVLWKVGVVLSYCGICWRWNSTNRVMYVGMINIIRCCVFVFWIVYWLWWWVRIFLICIYIFIYIVVWMVNFL